MKNICKLLSVLCVFGFSLSAFADDVSAPAGPMASNTPTGSGSTLNNLYVGAQFGKSKLHYGSEYMLPKNSVDDKPYIGRLSVGYSFTDLLSAELGYGYYGKPEFKDNDTGNKQDMLQQGIDLMGKVYLPLDYNFGFYVKAGAMWVHRDSVSPCSGSFVDKKANWKFVPVGSTGIGYTFNQNWATDIGVTATPSNGDLPRMELYTLGVTYKFGNFFN